jgi:hypothetical protein
MLSKNGIDAVSGRARSAARAAMPAMYPAVVLNRAVPAETRLEPAHAQRQVSQKGYYPPNQALPWTWPASALRRATDVNLLLQGLFFGIMFSSN